MEAAKKAYHAACKEEKLAISRETNSKADPALNPEQLKKLQDKVEKSKQDVLKVYCMFFLAYILCIFKLFFLLNVLWAQALCQLQSCTKVQFSPKNVFLPNFSTLKMNNVWPLFHLSTLSRELSTVGQQTSRAEFYLFISEGWAVSLERVWEVDAWNLMMSKYIIILDCRMHFFKKLSWYHSFK